MTVAATNTAAINRFRLTTGFINLFLKNGANYEKSANSPTFHYSIWYRCKIIHWYLLLLQSYKQNRNNSFFTIYNLWDSYHKRINNAKTSIEKIEKINMEYIEYFKKIDKLVVIKENKDGTLILKKDSK